MTIYDELVQRVQAGETFYINFRNRSLKIGKKFIIADGVYDNSRTLYATSGLGMHDILQWIETLYQEYKYSLPSERSDNKRQVYFKALSVNDLTDAQMATGTRREVARAQLEGFILCMIVNGSFVWDEEKLGKWFWQSKNDPDLVILRNWIENKNN
jgi:hypothetical protein